MGLALVLRALDLFHAPGDHIEEESEIDDAMYALRALRTSIQDFVEEAAQSVVVSWAGRRFASGRGDSLWLRLLAGRPPWFVPSSPLRETSVGCRHQERAARWVLP